MDFSRLSQNEKLAVYGSAAVVIGGLVGYSYGLTVLAVLAAIGLLAIVFLPQFSPSTRLPGSRGSLMLVFGGAAAVILVLALLVYIGTIFTAFNVRDLFFLIAALGGIVAGWASWRAFQAEGGKFQIGTAAATPPAAQPPATAPPAAQSPAAAPPPATEPRAAEPAPVEPAAPSESAATTGAPAADAPAADEPISRDSDEERTRA